MFQNDYVICKGNFNLKSIEKITTMKDIFYKSNKLINLKDKGDSSDLTCISKNNDKHILTTTSKNINNLNIGKLDIEKIMTNFQQYNKENNFTMSLCICIRDINDYYNMKNNIESTNKEIKNILDKNDTIIIDWNDLNQAYNQFKLSFTNLNINNIINLNKNTLCLKLHQLLSVKKTLDKKNKYQIFFYKMHLVLIKSIY